RRLGPCARTQSRTSRHRERQGDRSGPDSVVGGQPLAWTLLIGAGLLEIVWAIALKFADGFTRFWPSADGLAPAGTGFVMLSLGVKSLRVGTAYAVWVGIGVFGVAIAGMIALGENVSVLRLTFLALILAGIIGLKMMEA